jgi:hypothetical protein
MDPRLDQSEERKTAYQTAVQLMLYEGNVLWTRLNAMIVLNALLIASSTLLVQGNTGILAAFLPPLLGALLSATLCAIIYRGQDFHRYWEATAVNLETPLSDASLKIVSRGAQLRTDGRVRVGASEMKLNLRRFRARRAILLVTGLLIAADVLLAVLILRATPTLGSS